MKFLCFTSLILLTILTTGCSSRDDDGGEGNDSIDCLNLGPQNLDIIIQESFTTLPSQVSVFFKVNDSNGNGISGLTPSNFTIFEQGRNDDCFNQISSSEASASISPNAQIFANNTLLILDLSNSVLSESLPELKIAASSFIATVMPAIATESFKMGIYWFDGEDILHELQNPTSMAQELQDAIEGIDQDISNDPSTDLFGAIIKSVDIASTIIEDFENEEIFAAVSVVIFTDGSDQAARFTEEQALNAVSNADDDINFFTIGLGSEIDEEVLSEVGTSGSVFVDQSEELESVFNDISNDVSEQANSFYLFEYCSPKRDGSGENNLVIQVIDDTQNGIVQTTFDATDFSAGCQ